MPPLFVSVKNRSVNGSYFGFDKNKTLVSYKASKNKIVLLASSMHYNNSIDENTGEKNKPDIITVYNSTKGGVDTSDWMA